MLSLKNKLDDPEIWQNKNNKNIFQEIKNIEKKIIDYNRIEKSLITLVDLYSLYKSEEDDEALQELFNETENLKKDSSNIRQINLMDNPIDSNNAFVEIHAGAGGTESQDWAEMLQRMYIRWSESKNFSVSLIQEAKGEEAGIKSSVIKIVGEYSYGWLKFESGIHRLVRISPFDTNKRRHTSFASVWIYAEVDETINIQLNESDLRIDTYRASGAGGQHVNKTDSAVRIKHIPSNIIVQCQNDRSQHKNKATAMNMLKSRLYELEIQKKEKKKI